MELDFRSRIVVQPAAPKPRGGAPQEHLIVPLDAPWGSYAGRITRVMASMSRAKLDSTSPSWLRPARVSR